MSFKAYTKKQVDSRNGGDLNADGTSVGGS